MARSPRVDSGPNPPLLLLEDDAAPCAASIEVLEEDATGVRSDDDNGAGVCVSE
jgi:hypothetical protein